MKNVILAVCASVIAIAIFVSILFTAMVFICMPLIMSTLYSWWWMLGYVCYAIVVALIVLLEQKR